MRVVKDFQINRIDDKLLSAITIWKGKVTMEKSGNKLVDLSVAFAVEILNLVKFVKIHAQRTWLCPLHPKRVLTAAPIGCRQLCPYFSLS